MKRYDKYKDSGVAWFGQMPEHWEKQRLKYSLTQVVATDGKSNNKIGLENLESSTGKFIYTESEFEGGGVSFETNDILYGKLRPYLQKVWLAEWCGQAVGDFFVFRTRDNNSPRYFKYFLLSQLFTDLANGATQGAKMPRVGIDFIMNMVIAVPPLAEQEAIAAYLDEKCEAIDGMVEKIEEKIALFNRLRRAIITRAVTRGLNPDAPLRPSGIDWIGEIPEHWEIAPMKSEGKFCKGLSFTKADLTEQGLPVVSYGQVHSKANPFASLSDEVIRFIPESLFSDNEKAVVNKGDFVFADTSEDLEGCGNAVYNDSNEAIYGGYHTVIYRRNNPNGKFFAYLFQSDSWRSQIRSKVTGTKVYSITQTILNGLSICIPPTSEQQAIADYLDRKCGKIDELVAKYEKQQELLARYKKALIAQVVTGQRRVCEPVFNYKASELDNFPISMAAEI